MKIYTKKGDLGETSILGGVRLKKHELRIDAYGTIDELNSYVGLLRDLEGTIKFENDLIEIQDRLFTLGSHLASDPMKNKMTLPEFHESDIQFLETKIDEMEKGLPEMKSFVLPGGHQSVSFCHISRCVCRRAERISVLLAENDKVNPLFLSYLNRLSDYFFMLGRRLSYDLKATEIPWTPKY